MSQMRNGTLEKAGCHRSACLIHNNFAADRCSCNTCRLVHTVFSIYLLPKAMCDSNSYIPFLPQDAIQIGADKVVKHVDACLGKEEGGGGGGMLTWRGWPLQATRGTAPASLASGSLALSAPTNALQHTTLLLLLQVQGPKPYLRQGLSLHTNHNCIAEHLHRSAQMLGPKKVTAAAARFWTRIMKYFGPMRQPILD